MAALSFYFRLNGLDLTLRKKRGEQVKHSIDHGNGKEIQFD